MKAYYIAGTHWDREWYEPFQEYRMWLVELMDDLLDLLEANDAYLCFHLDGQTVVVEDYLEIRPENRDRLVNLIRAGRILAGPWYDLPDEWLISGESFVRNLQTGIRVCRSLGASPMMYGYTPDMFGHIAALPKIMNGFGIRAGVVWRGTTDETYPAHFVWTCRDGSRLVTTKLMDTGGYGPFLAYVRSPLEGQELTDEALHSSADPYFEKERTRTPIPLVLLIDALDHLPADPRSVEILDRLRTLYPDMEFVFGALPDYAAELLSYEKELPEREGELRMNNRAGARWQYLIVHTISARYPLKLRNGRCQAMMERWAEPSFLFARMEGTAFPQSYLHEAWKHLLKNHPHDSICGCSIDQVHRDMMYRFDQCEMIGDGVRRRALTALGRSSANLGDAYRNIVIHNPLPFERREVIPLDVEFPEAYDRRFVDGLTTGDQINRFLLKDGSGEELRYQHVSIERGRPIKLLGANGRRVNARSDRHMVAAEVTLPPCGFTTIRVEETDAFTRTWGTLRTGPLSAENEYLSLEVGTDGTARVTFKATGKVFDDLFLYEDAGEVGDGWTRGIPADDRRIVSPGSPATSGVEEDGPVRVTFRIDRELRVPEAISQFGRGRSGRIHALKIADFLSIEAGTPFVRVRTVVENTAADHRLRVLFPLGIASEMCYSDQPFEIVERPVALDPARARDGERENPERAHHTYFGVEDGCNGLAVLCPFGLHEHEVMDDRDRTLALTLLRCFSRTVGTAGEPDGQLQGAHTFEYLLYPYAGPADHVDLARKVAAAQTGVFAHLSEEDPGMRSFLSFEEGRLVTTAIKPAEDDFGGIVRVWNPTDEEVTDRLVCEKVIRGAAWCDLKEENREEISFEPHAIPLTVPAGAIRTVWFDVER